MGNNMHMSELYGSSKHWVSFTTLWHVKVGRRRLSEERRKDDGQKDKARNKGWEREEKGYDMKLGSEKFQKVAENS